MSHFRSVEYLGFDVSATSESSQQAVFTNRVAMDGLDVALWNRLQINEEPFFCGVFFLEPTPAKEDQEATWSCQPRTRSYW